MVFSSGNVIIKLWCYSWGHPVVYTIIKTDSSFVAFTFEKTGNLFLSVGVSIILNYSLFLNFDAFAAQQLRFCISNQSCCSLGQYLDFLFQDRNCIQPTCITLFSWSYFRWFYPCPSGSVLASDWKALPLGTHWKCIFIHSSLQGSFASYSVLRCCYVMIV